MPHTLASQNSVAPIRLLWLGLALALVGCSASNVDVSREPGSASGTTSSPAAEAGPSASCGHDSKTLRCVKYLKNYDADTITFDVPGVHPLLGDKISVRVSGVDAPEVKGKDDCEKKSARIAKNLVENVMKRGKRIDLVDVGRDKYFRILADVVVDGRNLKEILQKNGLVYEYHGGTKRKVDWCAVARGEGRLPADE